MSVVNLFYQHQEHLYYVGLWPLDQKLHTIYVYLANEGVDVWRPVMAERLEDDVFRIASHNENPDDEQWQFKAGEIVRCSSKVLSVGSSVLVAVERLTDAEQS